MMHSPNREFTRGTLAKAAGVNLETIRFYEKIGLLPAPPRSPAGHRRYSDDHLRRLVFIRRVKELGFVNKDIVALLDITDGDYTCSAIKSLAEIQLAAIDRKIADLQQMKTALEALASECSGDETPDCAFVQRLFGPV